MIDFVTIAKSAKIFKISKFSLVKNWKTRRQIKKLTVVKSSCIFQIYKRCFLNFAVSGTVCELQFWPKSKIAKNSHLKSKFRNNAYFQTCRTWKVSYYKVVSDFTYLHPISRYRYSPFFAHFSHTSCAKTTHWIAKSTSIKGFCIFTL